MGFNTLPKVNKNIVSVMRRHVIAFLTRLFHNLGQNIVNAPISSCYKIWNHFLGVTLPPVGRFSLYNRKSAELWLVQNLELHVVVVCLNRDSTCSTPRHTFINDLPYR